MALTQDTHVEPKTIQLEYPFDLPEENCAGTTFYVPWVVERHLVKRLGMSPGDYVELVKRDRTVKGQIQQQPTDCVFVVSDSLN